MSNSTNSSECSSDMEWYIQLPFIVAFMAMITIAAVGNIIVIWIVLAHKRMRTVTNYFLVNLAIADALISIFNAFFNFLYMLKEDWWFGSAFCKTSMFLAPCTITVSVLTFMAIAVERYIAIVHPLKPRMSSKSILFSIALIWLISSIISVPNIFFAQLKKQEICEKTQCMLTWPDQDDDYSKLGFA
ncbi:DgyrCDS7074 [Dimorphilus gyrociliatus]|nr:DgyrCDS7074 [Dimorphilus gyrociliatus]